MRATPRIVIVYSKFGDGHYQAARAMQEQFAAAGVTDVRLVDLFGESHPLWDAVSRYFYDKSMNRFPRLYGWSYEITNEMHSDGSFAKWLHSLGTRRLKAILEAEQPDAVIHTFPFLAFYRMKERNELSIPGYTVITDYVLHCRWLHPQTDGYFVATDALKAEMKTRGVREERIHVTGIPLRKEFDSSSKPGDIVREYGLDPNKRHVLVMAGAGGVFSDLKTLLPEFIGMESDLSFILVTGRNAKLHEELRKRFEGLPSVKVLGYVEGIHRLMSVSSCIVTKAGGLTLTEALALRVPVIVYRPLPGQEQGNAEYWADKGTVRIAADMKALRESLQDLTDGVSWGGRTTVNGRAAQDIAELVVSRLPVSGQLNRDGQLVPGKGRRVLHDFT